MNRRDLILRCRALIGRERLERDLDDELDFHIQMEARKNQEAGMTGAEALRVARLRFGGQAQVGEECRDQRGVSLAETVWQDIRYAIRGFRRSPWLVATVVATIALGLGLDTALFTVFNATYFRPIGVRDPRALYEFYWMDRSGAGHDFSLDEYRQFAAWNPAFSAALGYRNTEVRLDGRDLLGTLVTGEYFQVLGVGAALGRTLLPEDASAPGSRPVVVLSYQAWQKQFSADPEIVGKKVLLRGYPFDIVGVAPAGFTGLGARPAEFWAPLTMAARFETGMDVFGPSHPRVISMVGRLREGYGERQARAGLTLWTQRFTANAADAERAMQAVLVSRATNKPLNLKSALAFSPILIACSLVLLIGCANVANLMLARSLARQKEIGIRRALGAPRKRLIRQLMTECLLLAVPSAAAGVAVSEGAIRICLRVLVTTLPAGVASFAARIPNLHADLRVFGFALAAALAAAIGFGLAPALQATRGSFLEAARSGFGDRVRSSRFRNLLVTAQVTTCVLLLVTAGILLRGVSRMHNLDSSLSARNTIQLAVQEKYREPVLSRMAAEPAVDLVAAAVSAPVERKLTVSIRPAEAGAAWISAANPVSPEYFALFEIPIVRGRNFTAGEAQSGAAVAVISQSAAERLWPNQEAVGRRLSLVPDRTTDTRLARYRTVNVIGVARDELSRWIGNNEDRSLVYLPASSHTPGTELLLGARGDAEAERRKIEAAIGGIDPEAIERIQKLQVREWVADDAYYTLRVAYWLSSAIGILALLLTLSGVYGVLSYMISQRTKEIGIRMALGATTRGVTGLVLKQSMRLALPGAAAGSVLALALSKLLGSAVVLIGGFDATAHIAGVALVLAACAAAAWFPSRRVARIDPLRALRYD
jgi:predicted permease